MSCPRRTASYKVGRREVLGLRRHAQEVLGPRFDVKAFHDAVLGAGTLSLQVLRDQVAQLVLAG